jgi:hypothetical protein
MAAKVPIINSSASLPVTTHTAAHTNAALLQQQQQLQQQQKNSLVASQINYLINLPLTAEEEEILADYDW